MPRASASPPSGGKRARHQREEPVAAWLDHLRVERGLAANTLVAYERDLRELAAFADERGKGVLQLAPADLADFAGALRAPGPQGPLAGAARVLDAGLLRLRRARGSRRARPDRERARAARLPRAAALSQPRTGRGAAEGARHLYAAGPARPRDPRGALRDGPARLGADGARARRARPRAGCRARLRQGRQGAAGAARARGAPLREPLPGRDADATSPARAPRTSCS